MARPLTAEAEVDRFDVASADGTSLAVWVEGSGPALVLVHGALSDHRTYAPLVSELRDDLTLYSMDRRGRGASGDAAEYSLEREFDDVAAVVDAVAARTGGPVALWGFSFGADTAMGGAARSDHVARLVLYEPELGVATPLASIEAMERALAAGDREAAAITLLVDIVEMSDDEVELLRSSPLWETRLAIVPTVPRELRAEAAWVYRPGQFDTVTAPTLVLSGSESPAGQQAASQAAAEAIPGARLRVLEGHAHMAHQTDPAMVATIMREFVSS
jgi:pimeloyl-ACP methyl ester carboxylesterase